MANNVYSTMSADVTYHLFDDNAGQPSSIRKVLINGGSGVANKQLQTPLGVLTIVSDEDLEMLKTNNVFLIHQKNGFIKVMNKKVDPEVAVGSDMQLRDKSSPRTPEDYKETDEAKPESFGGKKGTSKPLE